ncbi:PLD nuclease N-terminal domain-containing protein [Microcella pacifica]|uniref:PLD nuclease N-terminal domain-containing protein n=1 Tax=Microcella pacifica TaxID=2591847 RepID=UPI001AEF4AD3|nr:PLD nuclease N-terminal domain-containing protein [Microcella pacifica]
MNTDLTSLPTAALVALVVAIVVQLALQITALIRLYRTPRDRIVFDRKWPWVLIILLVNMVGAIVFLIAGRRPAAVDDSATAHRAEGDSVRRTVQSLYGEDDRS